MLACAVVVKRECKNVSDASMCSSSKRECKNVSDASMWSSSKARVEECAETV